MVYNLTHRCVVLQDAGDSAADRSAQLNECVYREDSTVLLELTTRSMMEVTCFQILPIF